MSPPAPLVLFQRHLEHPHFDSLHAHNTPVPSDQFESLLIATHASLLTNLQYCIPSDSNTPGSTCSHTLLACAAAAPSLPRQPAPPSPRAETRVRRAPPEPEAEAEQPLSPRASRPPQHPAPGLGLEQGRSGRLGHGPLALLLLLRHLVLLQQKQGGGHVCVSK